MKLYEMTAAPNPRRVRIFLAEKGITVPLVQIDMRKGEHKAPEFLKKNPSGKIPVLELDDGTCIAESVAICRYFEALHPKPSLFGATPKELGRIEMANRHLEFELLGPVLRTIIWNSGVYESRSGLARAMPCMNSGTNCAGSLTNFFMGRSSPV